MDEEVSDPVSQFLKARNKTEDKTNANDVFLGAFSFDLCLISDALEKKRKECGVKDYDHYQKISTV